MATGLNPRWETMMLDTVNALHAAGNAFVVTAYRPLKAFSIDNTAFAAWAAAEGDGLARCLPDPGDASPGSTLAELVYRALSAYVLVGDPSVELNVHGLADEAGFSVRLNNRTGLQALVGLTRGHHELHWPPSHLTPSQSAYYCLLGVCCIANALLADLPTAAVQPAC